MTAVQSEDVQDLREQKAKQALGLATVGRVKGLKSKRTLDVARHLDDLRGRILTADELKKLPPPEWLVDGFLGRGQVGVLWGPPGCDKTFVGIDLAACVASDTSWHGRRVERGRVLYIASEGAAGLGLRVEAWQEFHDERELPSLDFLPTGVNLFDEEILAALVELVTECTPTLLVLDTLARSIVGVDENSAKDMGRVVDAFDRLRSATGSTVLAIHHSRKDAQTMRGSTALLGAADCSIECAARDEHIILRCEKQKDAAEFTRIQLQRQPASASCVLTDPKGEGVGRVSDRQRVMLKSLAKLDEGEGISDSMWRRSLPTSVAERTFYREKKSLKDAGLVATVGNGRRLRFRLSDLGLAALDA